MHPTEGVLKSIINFIAHVVLDKTEFDI